MLKSIREIPTQLQKAYLKTMKTVPEEVKVAVYDGFLHPDAAFQFHYDVKLYGLFEAILYVHSYERNGYYKAFTGVKAMEAACKLV